MKKIKIYFWGIFLLTVFSGNQILAQENNSNFTDTKNNIYEEAIYFLQGQNIIKGYDDQTFRPENQINRAEFLKILIAANYADELKRSGYKEKCFADIENTYEWYVPYACLAKTYGIIKGYDGNRLKPEKNINFAEAAKIITNVYEKNVREDSQIWYKNYVQYLLANKLIPPQLTRFDKEITRGEMSEMITRAIKLKENKLDSYLEFRKSKYDETLLPTWEGLNSGTQTTNENKVLDLTHPGTLIAGSYISNYEQYTYTDYPVGENNNQLSENEENNIRSELTTLLNQKRTANQKSTFSKNETLQNVAQDFAEHLVANAFYSHMDLWGRQPNDRLADAGYEGFAAESIVWKSSGALSAVSWWENSALHWNNIMRDDFTQIGIGVVGEPTGGNIIVLLTGQ